MDIQLDINWIKWELDKVNDPYLIKVFISILRYRNHSVLKEMNDMVMEAEENIRTGELISHTDLKEETKSWRK